MRPFQTHPNDLITQNAELIYIQYMFAQATKPKWVVYFKPISYQMPREINRTFFFNTFIIYLLLLLTLQGQPLPLWPLKEVWKWTGCFYKYLNLLFYFITISNRWIIVFITVSLKSSIMLVFLNWINSFIPFFTAKNALYDYVKKEWTVSLR